MASAQGHPIGFEAAKADWNEALAGRPMNDEDFYSLTFGEQARYGAQECKTKGAMFTTRISQNVLEVRVELPASLSLAGIQKSEAVGIEYAIHKAIENTIHWILVSRQNGWTKHD
jgi:hypothetical protein